MQNPPLLSQKQRYRLIIALNRSILPITLNGTTVNHLLQNGIIFLYLRKTIEYYSCTSHYQFWSPSSPWSLSTDYKQEEEQSQPYTHENPELTILSYLIQYDWLPRQKRLKTQKISIEETRENLKRILIRTEMVGKRMVCVFVYHQFRRFVLTQSKTNFFLSHMIGWKLTWHHKCFAEISKHS
jgi:hypothetical protein